MIKTKYGNIKIEYLTDEIFVDVSEISILNTTLQTKSCFCYNGCEYCNFVSFNKFCELTDVIKIIHDSDDEKDLLICQMIDDLQHEIKHHWIDKTIIDSIRNIDICDNKYFHQNIIKNYKVGNFVLDWYIPVANVIITIEDFVSTEMFLYTNAKLKNPTWISIDNLIRKTVATIIIDKFATTHIINQKFNSNNNDNILHLLSINQKSDNVYYSLNVNNEFTETELINNISEFIKIV